MAFKAQRLVDSIRREIGQPDADNSSYTDTELLAVVNDELLVVPDKLRIVKDEISLAGNGTSRYSLPADVKKVDRVDIGVVTLDWVPFAELRIDATSNTASGPRRCYSIRGHEIWFVPGLSQTATLWVQRSVAPIESLEDTIDASTNLFNVLVYSVAARIFRQLQDWAAADRYSQIYRQAVLEAKEMESDKQMPDVAELDDAWYD